MRTLFIVLLGTLTIPPGLASEPLPLAPPVPGLMSAVLGNRDGMGSKAPEGAPGPPWTEATPRQNRLPRLTGNEYITLDSVREWIVWNGLLDASYQTAQEAISAGRRSSYELGLVGEAGTLQVGWAVLWRKWGYATILGNARRAAAYRTEAYDLKAYMDSDEGGVGSLFPFGLSRDEIEDLKSSIIFWLRGQATVVGEDAALLPDSCDPEGYIRQRLRYVYDELMSAAETVRDLNP